MSDRPVPLVVRRTIPARRDRVFEAFSRRDMLAKWFTPSPDVTLDVLRFDFVENGGFRLRYVMSDGRRPVVGGIFERIDPPAEIVHTWEWEAPDPLEGIPMRVRFRFVDLGEATEVVITHEGLPSDAACTVHEGGWEAALDSLAGFVTTVAGNRRTSSP